MRISTFFFLTRRGLRNLGKHWAMTFVCILSLSVCMTLNTFASLAEVNVDSMVNYLGSQNPRLHTDEILIALSISAATSPDAARALNAVPLLKGCEVHSSVLLSSVDEGIFKKLGMHLTCEPKNEEKDVKKQ